MRFRDPETGLDLLSHQEEHVARQRETVARRAAEVRVAELEALIGRKPG